MTPEHAAIALQHLPNIGHKNKIGLIDHVGGLAQLATASDSKLKAAGLPAQDVDAFRECADSACEADLAWLADDNHHLVARGDSTYPAALNEIDDPPIALWAIGDLDLLSLGKVAIVGSRNPTRGGEETAQAFASDLAARGLVIISGLAAGIDAAAHRGALDAEGMTLAVVGTGADRVYPAANRALAHAIAQDGLIVSEFPVGTPPKPYNFPRRNRLISALSSGVLVVEAAVRSGSLITARLAGEHGRAVMAIPGSIHNPMARGCHRLIREGAKLVECTDDVLEEIGPSIGTAMQPEPASETPGPETAANPAGATGNAGNSNDEHQRMLEWLGHDPVSIDTLVERSGESVANVSSILLLLELGGHVSRAKDGRFTRIASSVGTIDA